MRTVALLLLALALNTQGAVGGRGLLQGGSAEARKGLGPPVAVPPGLDNSAPPGIDPFDDNNNIIEDELIVVFKPGATKAGKGRALGRGKAAEKQVVAAGDAASGDIALVSVAVGPGQSSRVQLKGAAANIQADEDVEFIQPNFIYTKLQTDDPGLGQLWGMLGGAAGADAAGAWAKGYTNCSDVVIGVIDTGIQFDHPDLAPHMWVNPGETPGDGIDNDANGRVDDVYGFDFYTNDGSVFDAASDDDHGTHVAGTIGAVGNNGQGVVGVCQSGVRIISAKFLGGPNGSGTTASAVTALNYLLAQRNRYSLNLVATSNSWGGGGFDTTLYNAIRAHRDAGILFVAAAGNDGSNTDSVPAYPASYDLDNIISVGSITSTGALSSWSNRGAVTVDLFAPGSGIYSTWPPSTYTTISGTSMATPHVTGAVALYAAAYAQQYGVRPSSATIKAAVMNTGVMSTAYTGLCVSGKRLNIASLLDSVLLPPPPPPPKRQMRATLALSVIRKSGGRLFACQVTVRVSDAVTNAAIAGFSYAGTHTLSPDADGYTDRNRQFPLSVSGTATTTTATTTSPDFAAQTTVKSTAGWQNAVGSSFAGSVCSFTVTALTHPNYEVVGSPIAQISSSTRM